MEVQRVLTGAEPLGIVAAEDAQRIYVALSTEEAVSEYDADLQLVRTFPVEGRPSWLALHPNEEVLYVGAVLHGAVYALDLREAAPAAVALSFPTLLGAGSTMDEPYTRRITGELAVSPDGSRLAMPILWVENNTAPKHTAEEAAQRDPAEKYDQLGLGLSPNNPAVGLVALDTDGMPVPEEVTALYTVGWGSVGTLSDERVVRGMLTSLDWTPAGDAVLASMEGTRLVALVSAEPEGFAPGEGGMTNTAKVFMAAGGGTRGVAFAANGHAYVNNFLDESVADLNYAEARASLSLLEDAQAQGDAALLAEPGVRLVESTLSADVAQGRDFFFSSTYEHFITRDAGVTCANCHFDGRNDGIGWMDRDLALRQTPSLAGGISVTAPFTWTANVESIGAEAQITSQIRLGGRDATEAELLQLAAWVDSLRDTDVPQKGVMSQAALRGETLFNRADVGCVDCHGGVRFQDGGSHDLYDLPGVNTPALVGIAATEPYLHDGRAATLHDVLLTCRNGEMGDASSLSDAELDDLEAYLRTL